MPATVAGMAPGPRVWIPAGAGAAVLLPAAGYYLYQLFYWGVDLVSGTLLESLIPLALALVGIAAMVRAAAMWTARRLPGQGRARGDHREAGGRALPSGGDRPPEAPVPSRHEREAERQLLEVVARSDGVSAAGAALETTLTVAEADRLLTRLAGDGHLCVRAKDGRLLYGL